MSIFGLGFLSQSNTNSELDVQDLSQEVEKYYDFLPLCCNNISRKNCTKHYLVPTSRLDECFVCQKENTFIVLECATYFENKKKRDKATNVHSCAICFKCAHYRGEVDENGYPNGKGKLLNFEHKFKARISKKVDNNVVNSIGPNTVSDNDINPDNDIKPIIISDKKNEKLGFVLVDNLKLDPMNYFDESYWCHGFRHGVTNFKVANPSGFTGEEIQALFQVKRDAGNKAFGSEKVLAFKYLPSHNACIVEIEKNSNQYKIVSRQEAEQKKYNNKKTYDDVVKELKRYILRDADKYLFRRFLCIFALLDICKFSEVPDYETLDKYYLRGNNKNTLNFNVSSADATNNNGGGNQELRIMMSDCSEVDDFQKTLEYRSLFKGRIPKTIQHLTQLEGIDLRGSFIKN